MKKKILFFLAAFMLILLSFFACQKSVDGTPVKNDDLSKSELCQIGSYHNEILKNFIQIRQQPTAMASNTAVDEYKKLMADYGSAVCLAYKKNPPSSNIDQWVGNVLSVSISARQSKILDNIITKKMSMTNAINNGFGSNVVPEIINNYLQEIKTTVDQYGGSVAIESKLNSLFLKYYRLASEDERPLVTWISDVAQGSHDYWNAEYKNWNPRLSGRFWDTVRNVGGRILSADVSGVVDYFIGSKIGIIAGPISWKIGAAYAALTSVVAGTGMLLESIVTRAEGDVGVISVSYDEIYEAYLLRKKELDI